MGFQAMSVESEVVYSCAWCPCRFSSKEDLELHMKVVGRNQWDHKHNWRLMMQERRYGWSSQE